MNKRIIAVSGPSGAGKTTLTNHLISHYDIKVPTHTTTREKRIDDQEGFYRYLSIKEFEKYKEEDQFLISSGAKNRSYGVLKQDCIKAFEDTDTIILNVSYKDIVHLMNLPFDVSLIVLTFQDITNGVISRITSQNRNFSIKEIEARVKAALIDHKNYFALVKQKAKTIIYTDTTDQESTLQQVEQSLGYERTYKVMKK